MKRIIMAAAALWAVASTAQTTTAEPADTTYRLTAADSALLKQYELSEVTVTTARKLVKNDIDKLTYDVQRDEESKTKTVLEMLRKVPMVTVDGQDNIRVKGITSFKIYKNGHPDPSLGGQNASQILKSLSASAVKKIEVITDPGAKYDAEGTTYILNIVMKDGTGIKGVAGSVNVEANDKGSTGIGANVTTQTGKLVTSLNYGIQHAGKRQERTTTCAETVYPASGERGLSDGFQQVNGNVNFVDLSASYDIDSLNLLSASLSGYYTSFDFRADNAYSRQASDGSTLYSFAYNQLAPSYKYYNFSGRFDYQHKTLLDGEVLTLSYMGSTTSRHQEVENDFYEMVNMPVSYDAFTLDSKERFFEHTLQADYVRPLGKSNKIETGAKYINRSNKSTSDIDYSGDPASDTFSDFKHTTQVAAVYAEWMGNYGKWHTRAGLRYEYSRLKGAYPDGSQEAFSKSLSDWCPSASVQYDFGDADNLRFNYATSIKRPGISYLNPVRFSTPTQLSYGNPGLNSAMTHALSLTYTHLGKLTFNISPAFYITNGMISDIRFVDDGRDVTTYGNVVRERSLWITYYVQTTPWKGASLSINGGTGYNWQGNPGIAALADGTPTNGLRLHGWHGDFGANFSQMLPWEIKFNAGGGANYGREPQSVYAFGGKYTWNYISLQRSFLSDKRLTIGINAANLFFPKMNYTTRTVQGDAIGFDRSSKDRRQFLISISYRFGKLKASVKRAEKSIKNNDVIEGVKR